MSALPTLSTDILILGAGGAGLFSALHAKKAAPELDVTIAVKGLLGKCGCTRMVQGGYNVALGEGDSVERHFMDTVDGGKWLNDQDLAWLLVTEAQVRIRELENELGCFFDRNPDGTIHQKAFAGQTCSASRLTISMPVRSPLCTVRSKVWPAKAFWWMVPSGLRSKKQPSSFSNSRMRTCACVTSSQARSWSFSHLPPSTVSMKWRSTESPSPSATL